MAGSWLSGSWSRGIDETFLVGRPDRGAPGDRISLGDRALAMRLATKRKIIWLAAMTMAIFMLVFIAMSIHW